METHAVFSSSHTAFVFVSFLTVHILTAAGYNSTVIQSSINCNRTTVTFNLDFGSYLVENLFHNCIPLPGATCGPFGKIYVANFYNIGSEVFYIHAQNTGYHPISVDFHHFNLNAQSIGSDGYEFAEIIQVPLVAVPFAPNRTVNFNGGILELWNSTFPFFVNCLWTTDAHDNSTLGVGPGGNGGGQTGTVPGDKAVTMTVAPRDGSSSATVFQGDAIRVTINLTDTVHFAAELPKVCTVGSYNAQLAFSPITDSFVFPCTR